MNAGIVSADVIRQKGCDGTVTIEFSTMWVIHFDRRLFAYNLQRPALWSEL